jgi:ABC-type multidrug transport system ATPase subunit
MSGIRHPMTVQTQTEWAIELIRVSKTYRAGWGREATALADVTLRVAPGQVLGLLGPNGSGKSTVLKLLAGLIAPTTGECRVGGWLAGTGEALAKIGYLPETPAGAAHLTGRAWLAYGAGLSGVPASAVAARVSETLQEHGLTAVADRKIATYSKGLRQRLGLAMALVHDPEIALLDEPASGLDPEGRLALGRMIRARAARGRTVVFSSHLLAQAEEVCDQIALLGHGRVLRTGTPEALLGVAGGAAGQPSRLEELYLTTQGNDA